jgi:hypothetical protein
MFTRQDFFGSRRYIAQEGKTAPSFKASKDQITLLLGGNTSGDFKMKPLLPNLVLKKVSHKITSLLFTEIIRRHG